MRSPLRPVLCAALAVGAMPAFAQPAAPAGRPQVAPFEAMREAHERQRAQDLKTILRLRPDQEPALTAFLQPHRPPGKAGRHGPPAQALTTPQRLDEMAQRDAERTRARQARTDKVRSFYAARDAQQRQVFDALERMRRGGHGRGGPGRGAWGLHGFEGGPTRG